MNTYIERENWSVANGSERQYERLMPYVLRNICAEISEGKDKRVVYSPYRERTELDTIRKLDWHDEIPTVERQYLIETRPCAETGVLKKVKIHAKLVRAYCVKIREHADFIEVFSVLSNEHLVPFNG